MLLKIIMTFVTSWPGLYGDLPVARSSTEFSVVFDFWLSATGPHGGHAPVGEGKGDHLTGLGGGKNLGHKRKRSWMDRWENKRNSPYTHTIQECR